MVVVFFFGTSSSSWLFLVLWGGVDSNRLEKLHHSLPVLFLLFGPLVFLVLWNGERGRHMGIATDHCQQVAHKSVCVCVCVCYQNGQKWPILSLSLFSAELADEQMMESTSGVQVPIVTHARAKMANAHTPLSSPLSLSLQSPRSLCQGLWLTIHLFLSPSLPLQSRQGIWQSSCPIIFLSLTRTHTTLNPQDRHKPWSLGLPQRQATLSKPFDGRWDYLDCSLDNRCVEKQGHTFMREIYVRGASILWRASMRAWACWRTSMPGAISGAYCKSASS